MNEDYLKLLAGNSRGDALAMLGVLEGLRDGHVDNALELLEEQLDNTVLKLDALAKEADLPERERIAEIVRLIRDYRVRYPRHTSVHVEESVLKSLRKLQEQVRRILDEAK